MYKENMVQLLNFIDDALIYELSEDKQANLQWRRQHLLGDLAVLKVNEERNSLLEFRNNLLEEKNRISSERLQEFSSALPFLLSFFKEMNYFVEQLNYMKNR